MRNYTTEDIERYLEGSFSQEELTTFNKTMDENPLLKEEVELQRNIVKRVGVLAFAAALDTAHGRNVGSVNSGKTGEWSAIKLLGVILGGLIILGGTTYFLMQDNSSSIANDKTEYSSGNKNPSNNSLEEKVVSNPDTSRHNADSITDDNTKTDFWVDRNKFNVYTFLAEEGALITDKRSGTKMEIKPNSLIHKSTKKKVKGLVELHYREFRTVEEIALSKIPMDYKKDQLLSAGMFEMRAYQDGKVLEVAPEEEIVVDFEMTRTLKNTEFFSLNDQTQQWEVLHGINANELILEIEKPINNQNFLRKLNPETAFLTTDVRPVRTGLPSGAISQITVDSTQEVMDNHIVVQLAKDVVNDEQELERLLSDPERMPDDLFNDGKVKYSSGPSGDGDTSDFVRFNGSGVNDNLEKPRGLITIGRPSQIVYGFEDKFYRRGQIIDFLSKSFDIENKKVKELNNDQSLIKVISNDVHFLYNHAENPSYFNELEALNGWVFKVVKTDKESKKTDFSGKIYDIRIDRDTTENDLYTLKLKSSKGTSILDVKLDNKDKLNQEEDFKEYLELRKERLAFQVKNVESYEDLVQKLETKIEGLWASIDSLLIADDSSFTEFASFIRTQDEMELSEEGWNKYLIENKEKIKDRVKSLVQDYAETGRSVLEKQLIDNSRAKQEIQAKRNIKLLAQGSLDASKAYWTDSLFDQVQLLKTEEEIKETKNIWKQNITLNARQEAYLNWYERLTAISKDYKRELQKLYRNYDIMISRVNSPSINNKRVDPGHFHSNLVNGLIIKGFGVYNCDQKYRIKNQITVRGMYESDGKPVNAVVAYVIDKRNKGCFSFDARRFVCSKTSVNNLVIYDEQNRLYLYSSKQWRNNSPKEGGTFIFELEDITSKVKSPSSLARILGMN